jgi:hypothetical protein
MNYKCLHHVYEPLTNTVGAYEADTGIKIDTKVQVFVEDFIGGVSEGDVVDGQYGGRESTAGLESDLNDLIINNLLSETTLLDLLENLLLRLGLSGELGGTGTETANIFLNVTDLLLLPGVLLALVFVLLGTGCNVLVVVTTIVVELATLKVNNVGADTIQEILRVGDEDKDAVVGLQVLLEPDASLEIEMVGGLIEKQDRWLNEEGLS